MDIDTEQALVEWVNSFPLGQKATGFSSLSGGPIIWEVLRDIDGSYFASDLPEPSGSLQKKWLARWDNLKYIYQSLTTFLSEETGKNTPKGLSILDLKTIAMESDAAESVKGGLRKDPIKLVNTAYTIQLLKLVLLAAISSPRSMEFIGRMPSLSLPTQNLLKEWIVEIGESPDDEPNGVDHPPDRGPDDELLFEERAGRLMAEKDKLKKDNDDMRNSLEDLENRLEHSQVTNTALEHRLSGAEDRIRANNIAQDVIGSNKALELKIKQQEEVIAGLESDVSGLQARKDSMQKTIDRLQASNVKSQKLQDAVDELRTERDNLARKANTAEKYKQKLQAGSDLQKENLGLRDELAELRQDHERAKQARTQVAGLQLAVDEYKRVLPKIEQERHELQMMKKQLEFDNAALAQRCDKASEQYKRDQATITSLNERMGHPSSTPSSPAARDKRGLDGELTERVDSDERLRAKSAELKDENQRLQSAIGDSEAKIIMLEQMLDDVREHAEARERKHLKTYQSSLVLQSSLHALEKGQKFQDTEIFKKTQDQLVTEQKARTLLEKQLKVTQDELRESQNDLSLVDKDKLKAVEEVKRQQSTELIIVQKENKALQLRTIDLETDRAGLQALLRDYIDRKPGEEATTTNDDLKDLVIDLKAALPDRSVKTSNEELEKNVDMYGSKVRELNALISAREEQIQKQTLELQSLRDSLQRRPFPHRPPEPPTPAKTGTPTGGAVNDESASQAQYIANLERENRLMASAYHTLAGRLQMNSVVLQRRSEAPSAWLNKQRRLVDQQVLMPSR